MIYTIMVLFFCKKRTHWYKLKKVEGRFQRSFVFFIKYYKFLWSSHRFLWIKIFTLINKKSDENGQILIIDTKVNDKKFLLVNIYNLNMESEQTKTLGTLKNLLEDIDNISDKKIILGVGRFKFGIWLQSRSTQW